MSDFNPRRVGSIPPLRMYQYQIDSSENIYAAINAASQVPGVISAGPNYLLSSLTDPNPPPRNYDVYDGHWWINSIRARDAWSITTGSSEFPIGIIDRPVDRSFPQFRRKLITTIAMCQRDQDGRLYIAPDVPHPCPDPTVDPHGSNVAAIAAADGADEIPGVGLAWRNPIISVDVWGPRNSQINYCGEFRAPTYQVVSGIMTAISAGARVVNVSMGISGCLKDLTTCGCLGLYSSEHRARIRSEFLPALEYANRNNALVVFAAGNDGFRQDNQLLPTNISPAYPNYFSSNALIVGGTDELDNPACNADYYIQSILNSSCNSVRNSCSCPGCTIISNPSPVSVEGSVVDISAPAYQIGLLSSDGNISANPGGLGTSYSAPMVAGTAALMLGINRSLSALELKSIILSTARRGGCRQIGRGILNAGAAVRLAREISLNPAMAPTTSTPLPVGRGFGTGQFEKVISTTDGNFVAVGQVVINQRRLSRILKFNRSLDVIWDRTITADLDSTSNRAYDIVEIPSGYLVVATSLANHTSLETYIPVSVYQLTSSGILSSQRSYSQISGTIASPCPCRIARASDGSLILFSSTSDNRSTLLPSSGSVMARFDSSGNLVWSRSINPGVFFPLTTFVPSDNSDFFVGGYGSIRQITTRRISGDGQPIGPLNVVEDVATNLAFASNRFAFASTSGLPNSDLLSYSVDTNSQLRLLRRNSIFGSLSVSDALGSSDSSLVLGYLISGSGSNSDANVVLFNVDSSGNIVWSSNFGGIGVQNATSIVRTSFGYVICGSSQSLAWLATLDSSGNPID